jgi:hypothetical protein
MAWCGGHPLVLGSFGSGRTQAHAEGCGVAEARATGVTPRGLPRLALQGCEGEVHG